MRLIVTPLSPTSTSQITRGLRKRQLDFSAIPFLFFSLLGWTLTSVTTFITVTTTHPVNVTHVHPLHRPVFEALSGCRAFPASHDEHVPRAACMGEHSVMLVAEQQRYPHGYKRNHHAKPSHRTPTGTSFAGAATICFERHSYRSPKP